MVEDSPPSQSDSLSLAASVSQVLVRPSVSVSHERDSRMNS